MIRANEMKNMGLLRLPPGTFSAEQFARRTIYEDVDTFTDTLGRTLQSHLARAGLKCGDVGRSFKPYGSGFRATDAGGTYVVTISAEREVLPDAHITIWAQPVGNAARCWPSFESRLRVAVQLQFPDCDCQWMTIDEYIAIDPSR